MYMYMYIYIEREIEMHALIPPSSSAFQVCSALQWALGYCFLSRCSAPCSRASTTSSCSR